MNYRELLEARTVSQMQLITSVFKQLLSDFTPMEHFKVITIPISFSEGFRLYRKLWYSLIGEFKEQNAFLQYKTPPPNPKMHIFSLSFQW
jgi:hypothetical protein